MKALVRTSLVVAATAFLLFAIVYSILANSGVSPFPAPYALYVVGAATLAAFVVLSLWYYMGKEAPRMVARQLGGRGQTIPQIARRLKMSQDAVRGLLGPDPSAGRLSKHGKNFRRVGRNW